MANKVHTFTYQGENYTLNTNQRDAHFGATLTCSKVPQSETTNGLVSTIEEAGFHIAENTAAGQNKIFITGVYEKSLGETSLMHALESLGIQMTEQTATNQR